MGHYSPIVKQMRGGAKPEGMVLVVGSCADGIAQEANTCVVYPRVKLSVSARTLDRDLALCFHSFQTEVEEE